MTWQLFSPDLPFLQEMTITQVHHGFWDSVQPYLPLVTAIITGTVSSIGIFITRNLAKKARQIAEEQKKIALNKLHLDLFDKRYVVIQSYQNMFDNLVSKDYKNISECLDCFIKFNSIHREHIFLFDKEDYNYFDSMCNSLIELHDFRLNNLKVPDDAFLKDKNYDKLCKDCTENFGKLVQVFKFYIPSFIRKRLHD